MGLLAGNLNGGNPNLGIPCQFSCRSRGWADLAKSVELVRNSESGIRSAELKRSEERNCDDGEPRLIRNPTR